MDTGEASFSVVVGDENGLKLGSMVSSKLEAA
jgi:hypothetical protein